MPTKKPRFLVTMEHEQHIALKFLAAQKGKSVSWVINEMLAPALTPIVHLMKVSWDARTDDWESHLEQVEAKLGTMLNEVSAELHQRAQDGFSDPVGPVDPDDRSEPSGAPSEAGAGRASTPRSARPALASEAPGALAELKGNQRTRPVPGSSKRP